MDHDKLLCDLERAQGGDWMSGIFANAAIAREQMYVLRPYLPLDVIDMREWTSPEVALRKMIQA